MGAVGLRSKTRIGWRDLVLLGLVLMLAAERGLPAIRAFAQGEPPTIAATGQQTGFTYQGRLTADGLPANGAVDLEFRLWDAAAAGALLASAGPYTNVPVVNGLFAQQVDFGDPGSDGLPKWIEVLVKSPGSLDPAVSLGRLPFTVAPHDHLFQDWSGASNSPALALRNTGLGDGLVAESLAGAAVLGQSNNINSATIRGINNAQGGVALQGDAFGGNGVVGTSSEPGYAATAGAHSGPCVPPSGGVGNVFTACIGTYGSALTGNNGFGGVGLGSYAGLFGSGKEFGVRGTSTDGIGVAGFASATGRAGVYGDNPDGIGVDGYGKTGVRGSASQVGVYGDGNQAGVEGFSPGGDGVVGTSTTGFGVRGVTDDGMDAGVAGQNLGGLGAACSGLPFGQPAVACSGVWGHATKTDGIGTLGTAGAGTGLAGWGRHGVFGQSSLRGHAGVIGRATNASDCSAAAAGTICYGVIGDASATPNNAGVGVMGIGSDAGIWGRAGTSGIAAIFDGTVIVNGTFSNPSDARLKKDIADLSPGLDAVLALRPVTYSWLDESRADEPQMGFIAQEVRDVLPGIVHERDDEAGTLAIEPLALLPVLVNAIQEQQAQIDALAGGHTLASPAAGGTPWLAMIAVALGAAAVAGIMSGALVTRRTRHIRHMV